MYLPQLFIHLLVNRHLDCSHLMTIVLLMNICIQISNQLPAFRSLYPKVELLDQMVYGFLKKHNVIYLP